MEPIKNIEELFIGWEGDNCDEAMVIQSKINELVNTVNKITKWLDLQKKVPSK